MENKLKEFKTELGKWQCSQAKNCSECMFAHIPANWNYRYRSYCTLREEEEPNEDGEYDGPMEGII